jgi:AraC family transcriptional regulator
MSTPEMHKRILFEGDLLKVGFIAVRPTSAALGEIEEASVNVLALPLAGVFAKHDGPRRHVIATPNHALLISRATPYRLSFPGCIGDQCLTLQFSGEALSNLFPQAAWREGFDGKVFASDALLEPGVMLARSCLWRGLSRGEIDPLEVEELGTGLLQATLRAARKQPRRRRAPRDDARHVRQVERVKEAIAVDPVRKWTLAELASLACISPSHLAHVFRDRIGTSVYHYVLRTRLAASLSPVLDTCEDLTQVALSSGFASHSHFTARFRAHFGRTPSALRRNASPGAAAQLRRIVTAPRLANA